MEMSSSVLRILLIISKLQFCFESNQEPGKISHVRRYRMNLYHSNYAFAWRFCEMANWGSMCIATDCIFRLACGNFIRGEVGWTRSRSSKIKIKIFINLSWIDIDHFEIFHLRYMTQSFHFLTDFSMKPSTTFPHH